MTTSEQRLAQAVIRLTRAFPTRRKRPSRKPIHDTCSRSSEPSARRQHKAATPSRIEDSSHGHTDQGVLDNIAIPLRNPFLSASRQIKYDYDKKRGRVTEDIAEKAYEIGLLVPSPPTAIHTAKELHTCDSTIQSTSSVKNARTIAAKLYARYHYIYDDAMQRFVIPETVNAQSGLRQSLMRDIIRGQISISVQS